MSPVVVAFPVWKRADLLQRTLESWSKVRGVQDAVLEFYCEPGCDESVALCESVDFCTHRVFVNHRRLGHAANVLEAMNNSFCATDYTVLALDDFLVSTDVLELYSWHRDRYRDDPSVLALTAGRDVPAPSGGLAGVWRCQLIGACTGFHRDKWQLLARRWGEATDAGWWPWVNREFLQGGPGLDVLFPSFSRADDIGDVHTSTCFIPDPPPQVYYEVKGREHAQGFYRWWEGG